MKIFFVSLLLFFNFGFKLFSEIVDLEKKYLKDFVLETKRIKIPGYPRAFNASIIKWNDSILMSFRVIPDRRYSFNSYIGLIFLDKNFSPIGEPQILNLRRHFNFTCPSRAEDARLIMVGKQLYIVYSDNSDLMITKGGFRVYLAEVHLEEKRFVIKNAECLSKFENSTANKREKNWVPFEYKNNLLLAYSLVPHKILRPFIGRGECETLSLTNYKIDWSHGEPRGGTPAILVDGNYLSFFHSSLDMASLQSQGKKISHYFMGAYTFNSFPPFSITKMSKDPIVGKKFYTGNLYKPYWKPIRVVFPCGVMCEGPYIYVAYGRQDNEIWISKMDKKRLLQSLSPVIPITE